jgi:hypothetical protein
MSYHAHSIATPSKRKTEYSVHENPWLSASSMRSPSGRSDPPSRRSYSCSGASPPNIPRNRSMVMMCYFGGAAEFDAR